MGKWDGLEISDLLIPPALSLLASNTGLCSAVLITPTVFEFGQLVFSLCTEDFVPGISIFFFFFCLILIKCDDQDRS